MDLGLAGKWALVCGASKGLGRGCAEALVREGVNLVINARNADVLQQTAIDLIAIGAYSEGAGAQKAPKPQVLCVAADITTPQGREAVFAAPGGPGKAFDIVVTNAAGPAPGDFRDWEREAWLQALDANMLTPIALMQAVLPGMMAQGWGRVVNITSVSVKAPVSVLGLSNSARAGLTGFVAGTSRQVAGKGVTINNLLPGIHATDRAVALDQGVVKARGISMEKAFAERAATIPAGRYGTPEEFGAACAFLCSQHAGFIVGQNLLLDGGATNSTL